MDRAQLKTNNPPPPEGCWYNKGMKRLPYKDVFFPYRGRVRGNYKEDKFETNSRVYKRVRRNKYQWWADNYAPVGLLRGKRGRNP